MGTTPSNSGELKFGTNGNVLVGQTATATLTVFNAGPLADVSLGQPPNPSAFTGTFPTVPTTAPEFGPTTGTAAFKIVNDPNLYQGVDYTKASQVYTYKPTARGADKVSLTVTGTSISGTPPAPLTSTIWLSGQGVAPVSSLITTGANAGNVRIGTTGTASVTIKNVGDGNLAGGGVGNLAGNATFSGSTKFTGSGGPINLIDNASQAFSFTYAPTTHGPMDTANLTFAMTNGSQDGTNAAHTLTQQISGTGVGPVLNTSIAANTAVDFGSAKPLDKITRSLTITNATLDAITGPLTNLGLLSANITGAAAGLYSVSGFTPGMSLSKSQSATLQITFAPTAQSLGTESALFTLTTDEGKASGVAGTTFSLPLIGAVAAAVPEPSTVALLLTGMLAWGAVRVRRSRRMQS